MDSNFQRLKLVCLTCGNETILNSFGNVNSCFEVNLKDCPKCKSRQPQKLERIKRRF